MKFEKTQFSGLFIVHYFLVKDQRGAFIKPWLSDELKEFFGEVVETYFSYSEKGVFRGLHYQRKDKAQKKYVVCLSGSIEDISVDMRRNSLTYGQVFRMRLYGMDGTGIIVPEGFAHGIFAHEPSTIVNFCDKPYRPDEEAGLHWASLKELIDLPVTALSEKDAALPSLVEILL